MKYVYFVHFNYGPCRGSAELSADQPITSIEHIRAFEAWLTKQQPINLPGPIINPVIDNFILLRGER